jgi:hypothetical protein
MQSVTHHRGGESPASRSDLFGRWRIIIKCNKELIMANASKKKIGVGAKGKPSGSGAMTVLAEGVLPENMVLSNRDKALHSGERGQDGRQVQTDQYHDHVGARRDFSREGAEDRDADSVQAGSSRGVEHDQRVRGRAYELWEQDGRPEGRDQAHWLEAERELRKK